MSDTTHTIEIKIKELKDAQEAAKQANNMELFNALGLRIQELTNALLNLGVYELTKAVKDSGTNLSDVKQKDLTSFANQTNNITEAANKLADTLSKYNIDYGKLTFMKEPNLIQEQLQYPKFAEIKELESAMSTLKKMTPQDGERGEYQKIIDSIQEKLEERQNDIKNVQVKNIEEVEKAEQDLMMTKLDSLDLDRELANKTKENIRSVTGSIGSGFIHVLNNISPMFKFLNDTASEMEKSAKDSYDKSYKKLSSTSNKKVIERRLRIKDGISDDDYLGLDDDKKKEVDDKYSKLADSQIKAMSASQAFASALTKGAQSIITSCANFVADQAKAAVEMLKYAASFSSSASKVNTSAINQQLETGLSSSDNYGLTMALQKVGLNSYSEYLEYLPFMTENQKSIFNERLTTASQRYDEWEESGIFDTIEEWENTYEDFQYDMQVAFVDFFSENKETIQNLMDSLIDAMPTILSALQGILSIVTNILNFFGHSSSSSKSTSDIIANYSGNNSSGKANVTIQQTFNNGASKDALLNKETYEQGAELTYNTILSFLKS